MNAIYRSILPLIIIGAVAPHTRADRFTHRFGDATAGQATFVRGFDPEDPRISVRNGLRIEDREGQLESAGVETIFGIEGDGRVELRFQINELAPADQGWGNGVQLRLEFADEIGSGFTIARQIMPDGSDVIMLDPFVDSQNIHQTQFVNLADRDYDREVEGLAIERSGDVLLPEIFVDNTWISLVQFPAPRESIVPIGVWCGTGGGSGAFDITLESLTVSGAGFPTVPLAVSDSFSFWRLLLFGSLAICSLGIVVYVRRQIRGPTT